MVNTFETINNTMKKIKITQIRSGIGRPLRQKRTLEALGIRRMHHSVEHEATPQILGMVNKVKHLVEVQDI
jgi:large subunit ribosomal protein L30